MWIVLPPSETKDRGGAGPELDLDALVFPQLRAQREQVLGALRQVSADLPAARAALKVTATKDSEIAANIVIPRAPTRPAVERYTGVLYDALAVARMTAAQRSRAEARIIVISALFGAVRADDLIPAYRLSAGSRLPGLGTIASVWRASLGPLLAGLDGPVLDLRSGAYAAFASLPDAITVRVVTEAPDGTRTVVSHFNKATKGRLARIVATAPQAPTDGAGVLELADNDGMRVERTGPTALEIVT